MFVKLNCRMLHAFAFVMILLLAAILPEGFRVEWFLREKKRPFGKFCQMVRGSQFHHFIISLWNNSFYLGAGPVTVTLKWTHTNLKEPFWSLLLFFDFWKAKNEKKLPKRIVFLWSGKKQVCPCWGYSKF